MVSKQIYTATTGRRCAPDKDVISYLLIQSFEPGTITPEDANKLGYQMALEFTGGEHQFIVATHVDKKISLSIACKINMDFYFIVPLESKCRWSDHEMFFAQSKAFRYAPVQFALLISAPVHVLFRQLPGILSWGICHN